MRRLQDNLSYLLIDQPGRVEKLAELMRTELSEDYAREITEGVEKRHEELTNRPMSNYMGLQVFSLAITHLEVFKSQLMPVGEELANYERFLNIYRQRLLHYHNTQYDQSSDS